MVQKCKEFAFLYHMLGMWCPKKTFTSNM